MNYGSGGEGMPEIMSSLDYQRAGVIGQPCDSPAAHLADALGQNTAAKMAEVLLSDDRLLNEILGS